MDQTPTDNALPARLNELASVADACRGAFLAVAAETHWRPATGSAAAATQATLTERDPAENGDGILAGFNLVAECVVTFLEVGAGHLGGIAALYRSGEAMFPPIPLVRSVMENCAHAMWVIGDATGSAEETLARAYLEEFASCEFAKMAAGRMGSKEEDAYKVAQRRWKTVRDRALAAFPGATLDDLSESKPGRSLGGQLLPAPDSGVQWMFELLATHASGSVTGRQSQGIYAFLSSGTHPSLYQARQLRLPIDHGDHSGTILRLDVDFLERLLGAGVLAFFNALSYTMSFFGLPRTAHEQLTSEIDRVLPGCLT